jgi:hypothetical protein
MDQLRLSTSFLSPVLEPVFLFSNSLRYVHSVSWIDSERPVGRPQHSWGRSMLNDLPRFGLDITRDGWVRVAQDRIKWNWIVRNVN